MALDTIGSIAQFITESFDTLPNTVSGNMVEIVDMARQHVANFTGATIGSNSIDSTYQPAIVDFAKADAIDMASAQEDSSEIRLGDLSVSDSTSSQTSSFFRAMGESKLKALGKKIRFARSLS